MSVIIEDLQSKLAAPKLLNYHFVNTRLFREPAIAFMKSGGFENGGRYTQAPIGSKEWYEFWEEQEKRCLQGYSVGGVKITGRHYFYLNFCPIRRTVGEGKFQVKVTELPRFWAIDYDWMWYREIARWGCSKEFALSLNLWRTPTTLEGGRHLGCLKTRRAGFSFKEASDCVYNYNFFGGSKSYIMASGADFLEPDGILNKVDDMLGHLNQFTDGWWLKNRQKRGTLYNQKASYIDDQGNEGGTKSEIIGLIVNDPNKARGKDAIAVKVEEAGSFKKAKQALGVLMPSLKEGGIITGQAAVFGTGGEEGPGIEALADIHEHPDLYDMLCFTNDWEEGYEATECGVFVPYYMTNSTAMDDDGNIDIEEASKQEEALRAKKRKSKDPKDLDRHVAENPAVPTEALLRVSTNIFPVSAALEQKRRLLRNPNFKSLVQHGELIKDGEDGKWKWQVSGKLKPIDYYPHKNTDDLTGCISIVEHPDKWLHPETKKVDGTLYDIEVDPYYQDDAQDLTSLFAINVYRKRTNKDGKIVTPRRQKVAWFRGRPSRVSNCHDILFSLSEYYGGAIIQSEIAGGGQGIIDRARIKKKLHLLAFNIEQINNKEIDKGEKNRSYFLPMGTEDKRNGLTYYAEWLKEPAGLTEDGTELWNIHFEYDLGTLDEIAKFNPERNADRISCEIIGQFTSRQDEIKRSKKKRNKGKRITDNYKSDPDRPKLIRYKDGEVYI